MEREQYRQKPYHPMKYLEINVLVRSLSTVLIIFFLVLFIQDIRGQQRSGDRIIKGRVTSSETGEALPNAIVYLNNTTIGTSSKPDGTFMIDRIPPGEYTLIISLVGFERQSRAVSLQSTTMLETNVQLKPKQIIIGEREIIGGDAAEWKRLLPVFLKQFIGTSENAQASKVLNPEVVDLKVDSSTNELIASSDSIIIIENFRLGYKLFAEIEVCRYGLNDGRVTYDVMVRFQEIKAKNQTEKQSHRLRRREAYTGSLRHFLKFLFERGLEENKFYLATGATVEHLASGRGIRLYEDSLKLVYFRDSLYCQLSQMLPVRVDYDEPPGSYILRMSDLTCFFALKDGTFIINKNGEIMSHLGIIVYGRWFKLRIADLVPFDYFPEEKNVRD
ncbi:MAG: carboxypeptidase-like regulatory domain-containing protein [bacterium]